MKEKNENNKEIMKNKWINVRNEMINNENNNEMKWRIKKMK